MENIQLNDAGIDLSSIQNPAEIRNISQINTAERQSISVNLPSKKRSLQEAFGLSSHSVDKRKLIMTIRRYLLTFRHILDEKNQNDILLPIKEQLEDMDEAALESLLQEIKLVISHRNATNFLHGNLLRFLTILEMLVSSFTPLNVTGSTQELANSQEFNDLANELYLQEFNDLANELYLQELAINYTDPKIRMLTMLGHQFLQRHSVNSNQIPPDMNQEVSVNIIEKYKNL